MFKGFSTSSNDTGISWPLAKVVSALESRFSELRELGDEGPIKLYGISENGLNFVVAMVQSAPGSEKVIELGFIARFVGFSVTPAKLANLNKSLHISAAQMEGVDLFIFSMIGVSDTFDERQLMMFVEAWRRDLTMALHTLSEDEAAFSAAMPIARMDSVMHFAVNGVPPGPEGSQEPEISGPEAASAMLSQFLGADRASQMLCDDCDGRGKRGFINRICKTCDGDGFLVRR